MSRSRVTRDSSTSSSCTRASSDSATGPDSFSCADFQRYNILVVIPGRSATEMTECPSSSLATELIRKRPPRPSLLGDLLNHQLSARRTMPGNRLLRHPKPLSASTTIRSRTVRQIRCTSGPFVIPTDSFSGMILLVSDLLHLAMSYRRRSTPTLALSAIASSSQNPPSRTERASGPEFRCGPSPGLGRRGTAVRRGPGRAATGPCVSTRTERCPCP